MKFKNPFRPKTVNIRPSRYRAAVEAILMFRLLPIPNSHSQIGPRDLEALLTRARNWLVRGGGQAMTHP